jgi:hypothetical protein
MGGFDMSREACTDGSSFAHRVEVITRDYSTTVLSNYERFSLPPTP